MSLSLLCNYVPLTWAEQVNTSQDIKGHEIESYTVPTHFQCSDYIHNSSSKDQNERTYWNHQFLTNEYIPISFSRKMYPVYAIVLWTPKIESEKQSKGSFPFKSFNFPIWVSQHNALYIISTTSKCSLSTTNN